MHHLFNSANPLSLVSATAALEVKANAFTIEKKKERIGTEEMKEAVWIVERTLSGLLKMALDWEDSRRLNGAC